MTKVQASKHGRFAHFRRRVGLCHIGAEQPVKIEAIPHCFSVVVITCTRQASWTILFFSLWNVEPSSPFTICSPPIIRSMRKLCPQAKSINSGNYWRCGFGSWSHGATFFQGESTRRKRRKFLWQPWRRPNRVVLFGEHLQRWHPFTHRLRVLAHWCLWRFKIDYVVPASCLHGTKNTCCRVYKWCFSAHFQVWS